MPQAGKTWRIYVSDRHLQGDGHLAWKINIPEIFKDFGDVYYDLSFFDSK